jgi:hypothetical protein
MRERIQPAEQPLALQAIGDLPHPLPVGRHCPAE